MPIAGTTYSRVPGARPSIGNLVDPAKFNSEIDDIASAITTALNPTFEVFPTDAKVAGNLVGDGATSDQAGIIDVVAAAYAAGEGLYWQTGTYVTTATIPHLHDVKHYGPGKLKRAARTFTFNPGDADENELFCSVAGVTNGDGLTSGEPMTAQYAVQTALPNYGPVLTGIWTVNLAAGTYDSIIIANGLRSVNRWNLLGPDRGAARTAPTAIINKGALNKTIGLGGNDSLYLNIEDIAIDGFDTTDDFGVAFGRYSNITMYNMAISNCDTGMRLITFCYYELLGSTIDSCTEDGILELFHIVRGNDAASSAQRNIISNCKRGLKAKEHCTGHMDYSTFDNNEYGIYLTRSCTMNASNCTITNNSHYGVVLRHGSFLGPNDIDWGIADVSNNTKNWVALQGSGFVTNEGEVEAPVTDAALGVASASYNVTGQTEHVAGCWCPNAAYDHTGTTALTRLCTLTDVRSGAFTLNGTHYEMDVYYTKTGSAGTATFGMYFDASLVSTVVVPAAATGGKAELTCFSRGGKTSAVGPTTCRQTGFAISNTAGANEVATVTTTTLALDDGTDRPVNFRVTLGSAADTVSFHAVRLKTTEMLRAQ